MYMADIKSQSNTELSEQVATNRETLRVMRFGGAGSRTRNVRATREMRRETARLLTEMRARQLAETNKKA